MPAPCSGPAVEQLANSIGSLTGFVASGKDFPDSLFGLIALMAAAKGTLLTMTISSCLTFGKIRQHLLSTFLTRLLPNCCAPWVAITATLLACAVLAVVGNLQVSAKTVVLMLMRIFFITSVAALVLRKDKVAHRHF